VHFGFYDSRIIRCTVVGVGGKLWFGVGIITTFSNMFRYASLQVIVLCLLVGFD